MPAFEISDARIIGTIGRFAVEAAKHEIDLQDHSLHALRFVRDGSDPLPRSLFLRALTLPDDLTYVIDVRRLAPCLAEDIPGTLERDRPGLIKYTLRGLFPRAGALHRKVLDQWAACGLLGQQLDQRLQARAA